MTTQNQKRHDSVLSWGAQRTGSGQRSLTDLEPASGEHTKATQNALNGYYSTDEPSMNSFVYTKKPPNATNNHGHGDSKRTMSAFERHRPRTPMSLRRQKQQQQQQQDIQATEEELLFEEGGLGSASLLGKATRVFSFPFSSNRKNPFRSVSPSPSAPVSSTSASISLAAKTTTSKSLPSTASKSTAPISLSMSLSTSRSGYNNANGTNGNSSGIPLTTIRSLPRPTFPRSHVAHISKRAGIMEARVVQAEAELKEQREKNTRLRDKISVLEDAIEDKQDDIPDVQHILKTALESFEDTEKVAKYRLHEALKKQQ